MIRTTVMLHEETHAQLRRIARRRQVPLAAVIREALTEAAESEPRPTLSFIGAVSIDTDWNAEQTAYEYPPITPPVSDPPTPEEIEHYRRLADERA